MPKPPHFGNERSRSDPLLPDCSEADLWEAGLLALSDEAWDKYAAENGLTEAGVTVAPDGTVEIEDPEIAEWVRSLRERGT